MPGRASVSVSFEKTHVRTKDKLDVTDAPVLCSYIASSMMKEANHIKL